MDEPYCVIALVDDDGEHTSKVPESCIPAALREGWAVIARDTDIPELDIEPSQSNPHRGED